MKKPDSKSSEPKSDGVSRRAFLAGAAGGALAAACLARDAHAEPPPGNAGAARPNPRLRKRLLECPGGEWPAGGPLDVQLERSEPKAGYRLDRIHYLVEPQERIAAYLLVPDGVDAKHPAPGICVWHQHAGQYEVGKDEPAGVNAPNFGAMHMTGVALAREGYVVLCPDAAGFGERNRPPRPDGRADAVGMTLERHLFSMQVLAGKSLAWKNILDMRRAVDVLAARPEVRADRLGCYGHSMGSTHTWMDRFSYFIEEGVGHELSPEMWRRTREHFAKYLRA
jgi:hypothetical protein